MENEFIVVIEGKTPAPIKQMLPNGNIIMREERVIWSDSIEIGVDHSSGQHHKPHAHIRYSDGRNYSVSIDDEIKLLAGKDDGPFRCAVKTYFKNENNIQLLRKAWNEKVIDAKIKFILDPTTNKYICPPKK